MLTFATVNWQNYLGRGVEYVNVLFDSVRRNLTEGTEGRFVVFTDDVTETGYADGIELVQLEPGLNGWFNKLQIFRANAFQAGDRVIFLDLDTVLTGTLDAVAAYDGPFAILRDVYRPNGLQSSVMLFEAGSMDWLWDKYEANGFPEMDGGDQAVIEKYQAFIRPKIIQEAFPGLFVSYKRDARFGIPPGASVVFFHGEPRPHEAGGWVEKVWKVGVATPAQLELIGNTAGDIIKANILRAEAMNGRWLQAAEPHVGVAVICAGGPSLKDEIASIAAHVHGGAKIFACNAVPNMLSVFGIKTDHHVMMDARAENAEFASKAAECLFASQCDEAVHEAAGERLTLWHPAFPGILDIVGPGKERAYIGGGTTCGMKAVTIAWALGYRTIHLYGFDSCYRDGAHHAYPQILNDNEHILEAEYNGKRYDCSPWMVQQAEDFETFAPQLMDHGVELHVHGEGLIPDIAKQFSKGIFRPVAADFRAMAILERLQGIPSPNVAEIGVFAGDLSRRLLARRKDLQLTMVDAWAGTHDASYSKSGDFHASLHQEEQDEFYELTRRVTSFAGARARIIRDDSKAAAKVIPDNSLDLVFIDADHSYEGCKADLIAYFSKVKPGGIISGHDYANDDFQFGPMVKRAVDEFAAAHGLEIDLGPNFTWFATKQRMVA